MFKLIKNNRGISFLDTLISIVLVLTIITVVGQFQSFVTKVSYDNEIALNLSKQINNKITEIYNTSDWSSLVDELIETDDGSFEVSYDFSINDEYKTNVLTMKIIYKDTETEYSFERSSFYD